MPKLVGKFVLTMHWRCPGYFCNHQIHEQKSAKYASGLSHVTFIEIFGYFIFLSYGNKKMTRLIIVFDIFCLKNVYVTCTH